MSSHSPDSAQRKVPCTKREMPDFCHTTDVLHLIKISDILLDSYRELMIQAER